MQMNAFDLDFFKEQLGLTTLNDLTRRGEYIIDELMINNREGFILINRDVVYYVSEIGILMTIQKYIQLSEILMTY